MWKPVLMLSLLPTVAAIFIRIMFCERVLARSAESVATRNGRDLARSLLRRAGAEDEVEVVERRRAGVGVNPAQVRLSSVLAEGRDVIGLGEVALMCGEALVAAREPDLMKWRQWAVRFGWAFPAFTMLVLVFAVVVGKLPAMWAITTALAALGIASGMLLATLMVERQAAGLAARLVDESAALPRLADGEEVERVCRALAYRRVVPGAIEWLVATPGIKPKRSED
jgi:hypothetical protein